MNFGELINNYENVESKKTHAEVFMNLLHLHS